MLCFCISVETFKIQVLIKVHVPHPPTCSTTTALQKTVKDGKYINNYIPTIVLHVYFSNDVARLQRSDVSESDDC